MIDPTRLLVPCNDNSISLPLKPETVTTAHIIAYICLIPPLIILIIEFLRWRLGEEEWLPIKKMTLLGLWVPKFVQCLYICIGNFLYGAALTMMTVELGKKIAGRLRPHFIDACRPTNFAQFCESSKAQQYTVDLICSNRRGEMNARESFPSAHAAASFYIAIYLLTYLQLRMSWKSAIVPIMRPTIQFAFIQVAFVIALTRVRDHYHFYSDIAAGAILGTFSALITMFYMSPLPRSPKLLIYSSQKKSLDHKDLSTSTGNIATDDGRNAAVAVEEGACSYSNENRMDAPRDVVASSTGIGRCDGKPSSGETREATDFVSRLSKLGIKSPSIILESKVVQ
ncbi:putative phosphatidate phosphatase-like [Tropilaelaps mercedesae]|uniref:Putative phosphatidate phosphatase-like n=1 Tax=Tropilaelaps mercedesae TaxID=418985 RepID=A0A1V9WZT3_9ACAR|nr:putative phosphatidate phosphatase-like [Tropilaelaps mercedesae]